MPVEKFTISRDDSVYECFPHLCRSRSGRILITYRESNGHVASEFCRLIVRHSDDGGESWSDRRVLADESRDGGVMRTWNGPKIQQLQDGRILLLCDTYEFPPGEWGVENDARVIFFFSDDDGATFSAPLTTTVGGICPDQVTEMPDGRWLLPANMRRATVDRLFQALHVSRDQGATWDPPTDLGQGSDLELDEASVVRSVNGESVRDMDALRGALERAMGSLIHIETQCGKCLVVKDVHGEARREDRAVAERHRLPASAWTSGVWLRGAP